MTQHSYQREISAVGVLLPVHDEEKLLLGALNALESAVDAFSPSIPCRIAVVLDHCGDSSSAIASRWAARCGALVVRREFSSVGLARRAGSEALLELWPCMNPERVWLATTDADSRVPPDWLTVQLEAYLSGTDLWAGRVRVAEDSPTMRRWTECYATERDPIHGASLGFSAALYAQLGGFRSLRSGEDRDFHRRAVAEGFRITYGRRAAVTTSSRRHGRAPEGFASMLDSLEQEELEATA